MIHILRGGITFCGYPWPRLQEVYPTDKWVRWDASSEVEMAPADCPQCLAIRTTMQKGNMK